MITFAPNFTLRRLTGLVRQSPLRTGLSTSPTSRSALNSPAQTLKMHTYPQAWTEAALRCKIEKARLAQIKGRDTHRMFKQ